MAMVQKHSAPELHASWLAFASDFLPASFPRMELWKLLPAGAGHCLCPSEAVCSFLVCPCCMIAWMGLSFTCPPGKPVAWWGL